MQAQELLEFARNLFTTTHWGQGDYRLRSEDGDKILYCALGGLRLACIEKDREAWLDIDDTWSDYTEDVPVYADAVITLKDAILATGYEAITRSGVPVVLDGTLAAAEAVVAVWNDDPARTKDDVIALLDQVRSITTDERTL